MSGVPLCGVFIVVDFALRSRACTFFCSGVYLNHHYFTYTNMIIKDLLETRFFTVHPESTWLDVLLVMEKHDTNGVYVVDPDNKYLGMVTVAELIRHVVPPYMKEDPTLTKTAPAGTFLSLCDKKKKSKVSEFMDTEKPFFKSNMRLLEIVAKSLASENYRLPVVDKDGKLIGVVNRRHIKEALINHFKK